MDGGGPLYYSSITHLVIRTAARDEDKWSWTASPFFRHPRSPWLDLVVRKQWEMGTTRRDSFPTGNPRWNWFNADTWPVVAFTYFFLNVNRIPSMGWMDGACVQWRHLASATFRGIFWIFETINFSPLIFFFFPSSLSFSLFLSRNLDHESKWSVLLPTFDSLHCAERLSSQFRQRRPFIQEKEIRCFSRGFNFLRKFNSLHSTWILF